MGVAASSRGLAHMAGYSLVFLEPFVTRFAFLGKDDNSGQIAEIERHLSGGSL